MMKIRCALHTGSVVVIAVLTVNTIAGFGQAASDTAMASSPSLPLWAYPVAPRPPKPAGSSAAVPDETPKHAAGSSQTYTSSQIHDLFHVPDWFPNDHPQMPTPVAEGRRPDAGACGYCHLPNGLGRPENQSIAGLPKEYIEEQVKDFKEGTRHSADPHFGSSSFMTRVAKAVTPEEVSAAADYFSKLKLTKWIRVVETDTVPKTHIAGGMLVADADGTEPIGSRVIEVSENYEQTELRNARSGFIAYAPKGSLKVGESLVKSGGNGKTMACTTCHGPNLHGAGNIPGIAGRSPSQMARQLIDFKTGARNGAGAAMMKTPVSQLTDDDIVAITAYLASLEP